MKNVLVVYNIHAGRKKSICYKKKLQKFLLHQACGFKFVPIEEFEGVDVAPFDTIIAMGGDGTVNKVAPYLVDTDKTLAIIPCGTANLLAERLGISANFNKALEVLSSGHAQFIDILRVNEKVGVLRLGLGYDSDIICKTPQSLKQKFGYFAYFIAGILFALRLKKREYILHYDHKAQCVNASCIIVANAPNMYRNLVSVARGSRLDDGLLDVFILKTTHPVIFFFELLRMIFHRQMTNSRAAYFKTPEIRISNKWACSHIDGEKRIFKEDIRISAQNSMIKVKTLRSAK